MRRRKEGRDTMDVHQGTDVGASSDALSGMSGRFPSVHKWEIWRTIRLIAYKSVYEIVQVLRFEGFGISPQAYNAIAMTVINLTEIEIDLVLATVLDLGFRSRAMRRNVYERAIEYGLALCPPVLSYNLRQQYKDQPQDNYLNIAMTPVVVSCNTQVAFGLCRDESGSRLVCCHCDDHDLLTGGTRLVFMLPRA